MRAALEQIYEISFLDREQLLIEHLLFAPTASFQIKKWKLSKKGHGQKIYMLVPKCALSQFANWDPSLRTEIHLSQFAHWAPVPKLGSQFAH